MKKCRVCGKSYIGDFCPKCGYLDSRDIICSECGKSYDPDLDTCPYCRHTVKMDEELGEVSLSSYDDTNSTKPYVKCVNVFTQKVVLSCIAFCLFFALFALIFAGFIYITPKGGMVTYSVFSALFASLFFVAVAIHAAKIINVRRRGVKELSDSYQLTSVYVFIGVIAACLVCGCVFLITDASGSFGKFPFYGFVVYSAVSLAALVYAIYVSLSVKRLRTVLYTSPCLGRLHNFCQDVRFRVAEENLSADVYIHYLVQRRGSRNSQKGMYGSDADDAVVTSTARAKAYRILTSKLLYVAILSIAIVFVSMFFAIRGGNYLYTSRRLFGGYTLGSETEHIEKLLDYGLDRYTKILGTPNKETDGVMYWYGDAAEGETCDFVMVTYEDVDGENKVTSVFYDREHVYDESDDFSTAEKTVEKLSLTRDTFDVHRFEAVPVDIFSILDGNVAYVTEFTDGSFYVSYLSSFTATSGDSQHYDVEWADGLGSYSAAVSLAWRSFTDADGVLTAWYADDGMIDVPNGVLSIADDALDGVTHIDLVVLPDTISSLVIPESVVSIADGVFAGCAALECVTIYGNIKSVSRGVFYNCVSLTSVVIPDSVISIEPYAFCNCSSLTSITIPEKVTSIGDYAFYGCTSLTEVYNLSSLYITAGKIDFGCVSLYTDTVHTSLDTSKNYYVLADEFDFYYDGESYCLLAYNGTETDIVTPDSVKGEKYDIGDRAFYGNRALTSITLSDGVNSVGKYAFYECTSVKSLFIGENVTSIGTNAFFGFTNAESVYYNAASVSDLSSDNCVFYDLGKNTGGVTVTICASVTRIPAYLFDPYGYSSYTKITTVIFEDGCRCSGIGNYAFYNCSSLTGVYIADLSMWCGINFGNQYSNPLYYAGNLYVNGGLLTDFTVPDGVTSIGNHAFYLCTSITSVTIPEYVTSVGKASFYNCRALEKIVYDAAAVDDLSDSGAFGSSGEGGITVTIGVSVTKIPAYLFYSASNVTSVTYEKGSQCASIGRYAFRGCSALTSIEIPSGVTYIGTYAFYGCTSVESVYYDAASVSNLSSDNYAFYNLGKSTDGVIVTIGVDVVKIPSYLFYPCRYSSYTNITVVIFEDGSRCVDIGDYAFEYCTSVTGVYIDDLSVWCGINFGNQYSNPLYYAGNLYIDGDLLTYLFVPDEVTSLGAYLFYGCTPLTTVVTSICLASIGSSAFYGCINLATVYNFSALDINAGSSDYGYIAYYAETVYVDSHFVTEDGYEFSYDGETYCLVGYGGNETDLILPNITTEKKYKIEDRVFYGCTSITSVTIPEGVTSIGTYAFYNCTGLENIFYNAVAADDLDSYNYVFYNAGTDGKGITLTIGESVTRIPAYLFCPDGSSYVPKIKNIVFAEGSQCISIGACAFEYNIYFTGITIPEKMTSIGSSAFYRCYKLIEVCNLSDLRITMGSSGNGYVAYYAKGLYNDVSDSGEFFTTEDGYKFYDNGGEVCYLLGYDGTGTNLLLPEKASGKDYEIYGAAFYECSSIESVDLPSGLIAIGERAFYYCSSLTCIVIPDGVSSIGRYAFYDCTSLTSLTIGTGVTAIGDDAFDGCRALEEINFNAVALCDLSSNNYVFDNTGRNGKGIVVTVGANVTRIPAYLFDPYDEILYSPHIVSVTFEDDSVCTSIGAYAFCCCSMIATVTIPEKMTAIGEYAFYNCQSLIEVYNFSSLELVPGSTEYGYVAYYAGGVFTNSSGGGTYFTTSEGLQFYSNDGICFLVGYSGTETDLQLPETVNGESYEIYSYAFYENTKIKSVYVPKGVSSIRMFTFYGCSSLTSVSLPEGLISIDDYAFYRCRSLKSISIPETVSYIGTYAFYYCSSLTEINIPAAVSSIGKYTFYYCTSLIDIVIPDSVTSIGKYAFENCSSLESVTIGSGVTMIEDYAFCNCISLEKIYFNATQMNDLSRSTDAFSNAGKDGNGIIVTIGQNVTIIPAYLFSHGTSSYSAPNIMTIIFEEGSQCTGIGQNAFNECTSLTEVYYSGNISDWTAISVGSNNVPLTSAIIYFYSDEEPEDDGNFWHYVNGEIVVWTKEKIDAALSETLQFHTAE